jgi:two-component system response regulator
MTEPVDILLVEDNPSDLELTLHSLQKHKLASRLHVVRDGAQALEYLFCTGSYADRRIEDMPKLIMLDLKLPRVDGLEVLERIKLDPRTQSIPVAVLTSSRESPDVDRCHELGVDTYVVKPVRFEEFDNAVRDIGVQWLGSRVEPARPSPMELHHPPKPTE